MNTRTYHCNDDCSEIAEDLYDFSGGNGYVLRAVPSQKGQLKHIQNGNLETEYYHQVFTDGVYIYDPRLSNKAVSLSAWKSTIKKNNPDVTIKKVDPYE